MKPNRILRMAHEQVTQAWRRFQLLPPHVSLDPNSPACYLMEAQGERGDGTVFAVQVAITKSQYDLMHGQQALKAALDMANKALQQLQTYTGCDCKEGAPCEAHIQTVH